MEKVVGKKAVTSLLLSEKEFKDGNYKEKLNGFVKEALKV
jgi:hypothetical protein